jgi:hypothetical protein
MDRRDERECGSAEINRTDGPLPRREIPGKDLGTKERERTHEGQQLTGKPEEKTRKNGRLTGQSDASTRDPRLRRRNRESGGTTVGIGA